MHENEIGTIILDAAFAVHKELGPGLLESTYETCLSYWIGSKRLLIETQVALPVVYKEVKLDCGYRIDMRANPKSSYRSKIGRSLKWHSFGSDSYLYETFKL